MTETVAIVAEASQGIGQVTAVRLARDLPVLVLVARNRAKLEEIATAVVEARVINLGLARTQTVLRSGSSEIKSDLSQSHSSMRL
jgi:short-subunit dehydrogenase